ncbi:MAG: (Fe-S)-binding protein [Pseudomonadota bacterium]
MYPITMGIILALGLAAFAFTAFHRIALLLSVTGNREKRWDNIAARVEGVLIFAFGQKRLLFRDGKSGLMHAFIFWGFLAVAARTIMLFGEGFVEGFRLPFMNGVLGYIYIFTKDIFEVLVTVGVAALLFRRIILRPKRLTLSAEAVVILIAIGILMLTDFVVEGASIAQNWSAEAALSPVGMWFAGLFTAAKVSPHSLKVWFTASYFIHTAGIVLFLNYLPYGKHFHIITAIPNVFLRKTGPCGAIRKMNLEDESATTFGVEKIAEMNWKQVLDLYSCTECGRCSDQCPANATGKKLSPKELTIMLRDHAYKNAFKLIRTGKGERAGLTAPIVPLTLDPQIIWDCTTCRACEEACPVLIEYVDKIVDMRRNLVLMKGDFAPEAQTALRNIENNSNPWGIGFSSRGDWAKDMGVATLSEGKDVEYLYFVGCAGSFDERAKKVSRAFVKCLQAAGVSFGILGAEEKCTGDSARRIGNEYLFQTLVKENIATFDRYGVKKVIATCPHCYNTIKNEFPQFGGRYEVVHHTELLSDLIREGRLIPKTSLQGKTISFHDSCYLGRYNEIYDAPRAVLKSLPHAHIEEMELSRDMGRCCGAGGGRMWMEEKTGTRINHKRLEDIQSQTSATLVASACPYCLTMLSDAVKETNAGDIETRDIAELVADAI